MSFFRKVPLIDILTFGGLGLFAIAVYVYFMVFGTFDSVVPKITLSIVAASMIIVSVIVLVTKYRTSYNWISKHSIEIFTNKIPELNTEAFKIEFDKAISFYVDRMLKSGWWMAYEWRNKVLDALLGLRLEFRSSKISMIGIGWSVKDKAGLQSGKNIVLYWTGKIEDTALFHELHHLIDEYVYGKIDYRHENVDWWALCQSIEAGWLIEKNRNGVE